jgi:hypothetical protein
MTLPNRTLAVIADELHTALRRETDDILTIGTLLAEAKAHVHHGEWLPWLKKEFSMSERSAQKYMKAAQFAVKNELSADLKLSPAALYLLSENSYWGEGYGRPEATDAVIRAAKEERVGRDRAKEIIDTTIAEIAATQKSDAGTPSIGTEYAKARGTTNPRDEVVFNFTSAFVELNRVTKNKSAERFVKAHVAAADLARLGKLLTDLANLKVSAVKPTVTVVFEGNATVSPELSAEDMKAKHAALDAAA